LFAQRHQASAPAPRVQLSQDHGLPLQGPARPAGGVRQAVRGRPPGRRSYHAALHRGCLSPDLAARLDLQLLAVSGPAAPRGKGLNILGAYCAQDQECLDLRVPKGTISASQVIELLTRMQQRHPETTKFILYLDNARYQHARAVREWVEAQKVQGVEFVLVFL